MNTMGVSLVDGEIRIRQHVSQLAAPGMLYTFDLDEAQDASALRAGTLLEQDKDFWLFEVHTMDTGRAGPGQVSPGRSWGEMDITFFTKAPRDKIKYSRMVEQVSNWFANKTVNGIRFRTFEPIQAVPLHGFTAYGGVINYQFEIAVTME